VGAFADVLLPSGLARLNRRPRFPSNAQAVNIGGAALIVFDPRTGRTVTIETPRLQPERGSDHAGDERQRSRRQKLAPVTAQVAVRGHGPISS
jgi:hypothetical protein